MTTNDLEHARDGGVIFCGGCGEALPGGTTFCGKCGRPTEVTAATEAAPTSEARSSVVAAPPVTDAEATVPTVSAEEVVLESERQRRSRRLALLAAVVLIFLSLVGRYAYAVLTTEPDRGDVIATFDVDSAGGRFKFDRIGEVRVPKGAIAAPMTIVVRRSIPSQQLRVNQPGTGETAVLPAGSFPVYDFEPKAVQFLKPVMLILPAPPGARDGLLFTVVDGKVRFFNGKYEKGKVSMLVTSLDLAANAAS